MHICLAITDIGPGSGPKGQRAASPRSRPTSRPTARWALVHGPRAISIMAEYMYIKSNQLAINKQYATGTLLITCRIYNRFPGEVPMFETMSKAKNKLCWVAQSRSESDTLAHSCKITKHIFHFSIPTSRHTYVGDCLYFLLHHRMRKLSCCAREVLHRVALLPALLQTAMRARRQMYGNVHMEIGQQILV